MDVSEFLGCTNVTIDRVKESPSKKLVILSGGNVTPSNFDGKKRIQFVVEMDGRQLGWIPNKTTLRNLAGKLGKESNAWIGKPVDLSIEFINSREAIIGTLWDVESRR